VAIITGTLHENVGLFMITFHRILLRMRNISDKSSSENQQTYFMFINFFPVILTFIR